MRPRLKKILSVTLCVVLAVYVLLAMTSFNNPKEAYPICTKVEISIEDESTNGFLSAAEIKRILERSRLYPFKKRMKDVNPRDIEDKLKDSPFVKTAQCYKTKDGCVNKLYVRLDNSHRPHNEMVFAEVSCQPCNRDNEG